MNDHPSEAHQASASAEDAVLEDWTGDTDDLISHADRLAADPELCDRVFATKQEAFNAGRFLS